MQRLPGPPSGGGRGPETAPGRQSTGEDPTTKSMTTTRRYTVGVFGVPQFEQQVLARIFSLSSSRPNAYEMVIEPNGRPVDIVLVDRNNSAALAKMQEATGEGIPTVGIVRELEPSEPYFVRRPFTATRMLSTLDQVVEGEIELKGHESAAAPPPATEAAAGYRALVVDDSAPVRKQVAMALERSGISADFAENGERALSLIAENSYDIIFLDVIMPGTDGYEVCRTIKRDKDKKNIPVVMLTGKSSPFDRVKGKLSGCDTYLTKPVSFKEFKQTLTRCLGSAMAFEPMAGLT